jgi:REP element-mobilizing transposase RayT
VEFPGAVYHLMARGNERREIFRDDQDRRRFLETLGEAVLQCGLTVYAYCLMPNHYHAVVGTPRGNLSRAAGWLQGTYTARFNARHRRRGHLFQGRFKAQVVEADEYGRWLVEYIHLNPVRPRHRGQRIPTERAVELARYEWSSHRDYAGLRRKPAPWLSQDWLAYWGRGRREAQAEYRRAIRQAFGQPVRDPWEELRHGLVLGSRELYDRTRTMIAHKKGQEEAYWTRQEQAEAVRQRVHHLVGGITDKRVKIWARVRLGGERGVDLAREYGYRTGAGVTLLVRRLEARAPQDRKLNTTLERLRTSAFCKL